MDSRHSVRVRRPGTAVVLLGLMAGLLTGCDVDATADSTAEEQLAEIDRAVQTAWEHLGPEFGTWKGEPWTVELYRDTTRPRACDDDFRYLLELTAPGSEPAEVGRTGIAIAEDLDLDLNENNHDGSTQDQAFIGADPSHRPRSPRRHLDLLGWAHEPARGPAHRIRSRFPRGR